MDIDENKIVISIYVFSIVIITCKLVIIHLNIKLSLFKSTVNIILEKFKWILKNHAYMSPKYPEISEHYTSTIIQYKIKRTNKI